MFGWLTAAYWIVWLLEFGRRKSVSWYSSKAKRLKQRQQSVLDLLEVTQWFSGMFSNNNYALLFTILLLEMQPIAIWLSGNYLRKCNHDSTHQQTISNYAICPLDPDFKYNIFHISDKNKQWPSYFFKLTFYSLLLIHVPLLHELWTSHNLKVIFHILSHEI
jgi:hypothetical protein